MRERGEGKREKGRWRERELESERETILLCSLSLVHQILNEEAIKLRMKDCKKSEDSKSLSQTGKGPKYAMYKVVFRAIYLFYSQEI